jgi:hypothetical protein
MEKNNAMIFPKSKGKNNIYKMSQTVLHSFTGSGIDEF